MDLTIVRSISVLANSKIANHMFHICVSSLQQSHLQNSSMISGKLTKNNHQNHRGQHGW